MSLNPAAQQDPPNLGLPAPPIAPEWENMPLAAQSGSALAEIVYSLERTQNTQFKIPQSGKADKSTTM